jgi:hypothetical protein
MTKVNAYQVTHENIGEFLLEPKPGSKKFLAVRRAHNIAKRLGIEVLNVLQGDERHDALLNLRQCVRAVIIGHKTADIEELHEGKPEPLATPPAPEKEPATAAPTVAAG